MARRTEIEVFGLSMLDTVTCGLGGGLILMLYIASHIEPQAVVSVSREQAVGVGTTESGRDGTAGDAAQEQAYGLASIVQSFQAAEARGQVVVKACDGGLLPPTVRIASLRDKNAVFGGEPRSLGTAVWWQGTAPANAPQCIAFEFQGITAGPCSMVYVADAHAYRRSLAKCVRTGQFVRADSDGIYELRVSSEGP